MTFYLALATGVVTAQLMGFNLTSIPGYETILYALLAIGLYGAIHGIDLQELRIHKNIILSAVTVGVVVKALMIGLALWLILQKPIAFLLGVIVAQIDPLSVSHLIDKRTIRLSQAGNTILRAWSSFDDPMTTLLGLYFFLPLALGSAFHLESYTTQLASNVAFAGLAYLLSKIVQHRLLLGIVLLVAIPFQLMLGVALCGLFIRPRLNHLPKITTGTFLMAAFILGSLINFDTNRMYIGILMGIMAFVSQGVVAFIITGKLSATDRLLLATAQYNGITSAILALVIGVVFPEIIVIVTTAVCTINILYYGTNFLLERILEKTLTTRRS